MKLVAAVHDITVFCFFSAFVIISRLVIVCNFMTSGEHLMESSIQQANQSCITTTKTGTIESIWSGQTKYHAEGIYHGTCENEQTITV